MIVLDDELCDHKSLTLHASYFEHRVGRSQGKSIDPGVSGVSNPDQ